MLKLPMLSHSKCKNVFLVRGALPKVLVCCKSGNSFWGRKGNRLMLTGMLTTANNSWNLPEARITKNITIQIKTGCISLTLGPSYLVVPWSNIHVSIDA